MRTITSSNIADGSTGWGSTEKLIEGEVFEGQVSEVTSVIPKIAA
jgi:hypothetical protein